MHSVMHSVGMKAIACEAFSHIPCVHAAHDSFDVAGFLITRIVKTMQMSGTFTQQAAFYYHCQVPLSGSSLHSVQIPLIL